MHDPSLTFHNRTDPSNDAVASMACFSGFFDPGPVGLLRKRKCVSNTSTLEESNRPARDPFQVHLPFYRIDLLLVEFEVIHWIFSIATHIPDLRRAVVGTTGK